MTDATMSFCHSSVGLELLTPPSRNAAALRGASGERMRGDRPGVDRAGAGRDGTVWMETAPGIHVEANRRLCLTFGTVGRTPFSTGKTVVMSMLNTCYFMFVYYKCI